MRKLRLSPFLASILAGIFLLTVDPSVALDRQPNGDYHARREALARKVGGMVVLFAPLESEGPNDLYGFRQEDNFYYLSGLGEPGVGLLIAPAVEGTSDKPAQPYTSRPPGVSTSGLERRVLFGYQDHPRQPGDQFPC